MAWYTGFVLALEYVYRSAQVIEDSYPLDDLTWAIALLGRELPRQCFLTLAPKLMLFTVIFTNHVGLKPFQKLRFLSTGKWLGHIEYDHHWR